MSLYVLGIDGGGTKTTAVITTVDGEIVASKTVGPTNPNSIGYEKISNELALLLGSLQEERPDAFRGLTCVFAGMSGIGRPEDQEAIKKIISPFFSTGTTIVVDNDAPIALYSGTLGKHGIVNICGTGNITFGINHKNERMRIGGWGYLLGDPGSGYYIGRLALKAVYAAYDQIGQETLLTPLVLQHFQVEQPDHIVPIIYEQGMARKTISSLCRLVFQAAAENDFVAKEIINKTGIEMAKSISGLVEKLYPNYEELVPVVLVGGVYEQKDWFIPVIRETLENLDQRLEYIVPALPPVAGAICAAIKEQYQKLPKSFSYR